VIGAAEPGLLPVGGMAWRVNREAAVLAGGTCALLLQLAHPAVAAGVAEHSDFRAQPFGRLRRTLTASYALAFGADPGVDWAVRHLNAVHAGVRGVVPETGNPYHALDPELLLWVHATLVDTAIRVYQRFVEPLTDAQADAVHRDMRPAAEALGIPSDLVPASLGELRAWMDERIESGEVRVGPTARALLPSVLYPLPAIPRWIWDLGHLVSLSTLDPRIRRQYRIGWSPARERGIDRLAEASRYLLPRLPEALRVLPGLRRGPGIMPGPAPAHAMRSRGRGGA
jgi:uncharacterized protein (DUF2236 family)